MLLGATCVMAYFGFLRCGEFTILHSFDPECNVCMEDVHFHKDRVTLHLKASKTDPFREGVDIHLFSSGASVCPVISLDRYVEFRNKTFERNNDKEPFFVMEIGRALTKDYFIYSLKRILTSLGYNSDMHNGHSFRIGASTTAGSKIEVGVHYAIPVILELLCRQSSRPKKRYSIEWFSANTVFWAIIKFGC